MADVRTLEFAPRILALQARPPAPLPRMVLWLSLALAFGAIGWAAVGRLDIIAVASGRLVPKTYLQIVQPAEAGIVKEILVREGDAVKADQVLARMDMQIAIADATQLLNEITLKSLQLRRIDAELGGHAPTSRANDPPALFAQAQAQYLARRRAYQDALDAEHSALAKAEQDLRGATELEAKLRRTLPIYQEQEQAWEKLGKDGFAGRMIVLDKTRERIEREQEMRAQQASMDAARASIAQSRAKIAQIGSNYRQQLQAERAEAQTQMIKLEQDLARQVHKHSLLELRAPQAGIVKDLATHTVGSVLAPGAVLMTLVPTDVPLQAEVWVGHDDVGFVAPGQGAKIKLAAYPFQKYGMLAGSVVRVSPDAAEPADAKSAPTERSKSPGPAGGYRTLVEARASRLEVDGKRFALAPGMQVTAEIHLGTRTVLEYLLSPVQKAVHEAARER